MKLHRWFQNLNESKRHLFHFRGDLTLWSKDERKHWRLLKYELCSGKALRFEVNFGFNDESGINFSLGLLLFSAYITLPFPMISSGRKTTGFYISDWALVWSFWRNPFESRSEDPWWRSFYFSIDDFFLGRSETLSDQILTGENLFFKLGGKEFMIDKVKFERRRQFRRYLPYVLYHKSWVSVAVEINKPPMRSGKGENDWDCGDDGSYGIYSSWTRNQPSWKNHNESLKLAVEYYVENILKDAKRYGSGSGERGIKSTDLFEYIGRKPHPQDGNCAGLEVVK